MCKEIIISTNDHQIIDDLKSLDIPNTNSGEIDKFGEASNIIFCFGIKFLSYVGIPLFVNWLYGIISKQGNKQIKINNKSVPSTKIEIENFVINASQINISDNFNKKVK